MNGVVKDAIISQKTYNLYQSRMVDAMLRDTHYDKNWKPTPITRWQRVKNKVTWLCGFRIAHKDDIGNFEDY